MGLSLLPISRLTWQAQPVFQTSCRFPVFPFFPCAFRKPLRIVSFHPETALFRRGGVNPQACLCGVPMYASAQTLDFLATAKNCSFPI